MPHKAIPVPRWEHYLGASRLAAPGFFFMHVGANCGPANCSGNRRDDPIWEYQLRYGWRGVAIEANPHTFGHLQANYASANPNVATINLAVVGAEQARSERGEASKHGAAAEIDFWCPRHPRNLRFSEGCTTNRAWGAEAAFGLPAAERQLALHMRVKAVSLDALWAWQTPARVDLLVVDVEGVEYGVLNGGRLPEPRPALLMFETSGFTDPAVNPNGTAMLGALRARLAADGYVPLKLGDGDNDGWSRSRYAGANWKDDLHVLNTSHAAFVLPGAQSDPRGGAPARRIFVEKKPLDALLLDAQELTSPGCPAPHCRWHSRYVNEWDRQRGDWTRAYAPTTCLCVRVPTSTGTQ